MLKAGLHIRRANEPVEGFPEGSLWLVRAYGDGTCDAWHIGFHLVRIYLVVASFLAAWIQLKVMFYILVTTYLHMKGLPQCGLYLS